MKSAILDHQRPGVLEASEPPEWRGLERDGVRLLVTTERGHEHAHFRDLGRFLDPGALLVVNTSATLPASLPARHARHGRLVVSFSTHYGGELHLVEPRRSPVEPGPLELEAGEALEIAGLPARLVAPHPGLPRLWFVRVVGDVFAAMARVGSPIHYAHVRAPHPPLEAYQTFFARVPGSAEMPSAARPFTDRVVEELLEREIGFASVTLHAGVSSLELEAEGGEETIMYAEPFHVSGRTAEAVTAARREGRPVIAVGTTVVRALESAWDGRRVRAARGFTRLFVHPARPVRSVDGLITGFHDPLATHRALLDAVAAGDLVRAAYDEAVRYGYLWHEFGDSHLLLPGAKLR